MLNFDEAPGDLKRFDSTASFKSDDIRVLPRAFWSGRRDDDWTHFDGLQESISFFRELLEREKFDGVIGFSQGGTMATILTALCERPHAHPLWAAAPLPGRESYPWPPTPFKFCIVGSGFYAVRGYLLLWHRLPISPVTHAAPYTSSSFCDLPFADLLLPFVPANSHFPSLSPRSP